MRNKDVKKLKIGDKVKWLQTERAPLCIGEVVELGIGGVRFKWDDGQDGWISFDHMDVIGDIDSTITPRFKMEKI